MYRPTRVIIAVSSLLICGPLVGCKFGRFTNSYLDRVDTRNDRATVYLDHLYTPRTDLTRAGEPDWCRTVRPRVAEKTCRHLEGARNVPEPSYVVYPQEAAYAPSSTYEQSPENADTAPEMDAGQSDANNVDIGTPTLAPLPLDE